MPQDVARRLEALERELLAVRERLDRLEQRPSPMATSPASSLPLEPVVGASPSLPPGIPALVGGVLLALAGGYLVRALTEGALLAPLAGTVLGLVYALLWALLSDRAAARGHRLAAGFHGLTGVLLAYPLLLESAARFLTLSPVQAVILLSIVAATQVAVARRRELAPLAWLSMLAALGTLMAILVSTHAVLATSFALLFLAALAEGLAVEGRWLGLRVPIALVLDGELLLMVLLLRRESGLPPGYPPLGSSAALSALLLTPVLYMSGVVVRTIRLRRAVRAFAVLQGAAALLIGLGGAYSLLTSSGGSAAPLALATLLLAALCYGTAFFVVERRGGHRRNFYFYTTAGGLLALAGTGLLLSGEVLGLGLTWGTLALGAAALARHPRRTTLRYHAVVFLAAQVIESGAARGALTMLRTSGDGSAPLLRLWLSLALGLGSLALLANRGRGEGWAESLPQALAAALAALPAAGILVTILGAALLPLVGEDAATGAALRTGVLAALALLTAVGSLRVRELGFLVYPLLAAGGLKLLAQDLPLGRPATLVASLMLYGGALIGAPRLSRRAEPRDRNDQRSAG
jgi:hypothetical protein